MTRVRMIDVAKAAGVSRATVSFVLNETPGQKIRASTAERVRAAAAELGYVRSALALALQSGMSRTVVVTTGGSFDGHSLATFLGGMEAELADHDHALLVVHGGVPREVIDVVAPRAVLDLSTVYDAVSPEWEGGAVSGMAAHALTQMRHLADTGHERVAVVTPDSTAPFVRRRREQMLEAAARLGLHVVADVTESALDVRSLGGATAVATFADDTAIVVLSAMAEAGLRAPDDLAVIGFDDSRYAALWRPAVTTVSIDAETYGRRAARRVLGLPTDPDTTAYSRVIRRASA